LAYIFDPIQNTFIDDEDKSLGNKLQVVDLVNDLEPGPLKDEMLKDFDPDQETYEEYLQRKGLGERPFNAASGGRVNLAAAIPIAPMAIGPIAKALGISTAGLGTIEASSKVGNYLKENPEVMNTPEFRGLALAFGLNIPGVIAPDADEIEKTRKEIQEGLKPGESKPIDEGPIVLGGSEPPKIETTETFPAELDKLPFKEEFPIQEEKLPIIFENKKVENAKKKFDKVIELYETTGPGGLKRAKQIDKIRNKKFADDVKDLIDNTYGGNSQALANDLQIERVRINSLLKKHGIKQERVGNKTIQTIFLKKNKGKLSVSDLTSNMKDNETYLINRTKERFDKYNANKDKSLNYKDIAEIIGVSLPDKTAQDFFQTKLRNAKKKIGIKSKKGFGKEVLYNLDDTINALTKANLSKPVKGTGTIYSVNRKNFEQTNDRDGFNTRSYVLEKVRKVSSEQFGDEAVKRAAENYGHAEAIANQQKYPKLFKNSNAADISTLVLQDPVLNSDILQAYGSWKTGIEQKRQPILNSLEKLIGKKATPENLQLATVYRDALNSLNDSARTEVKEFQKTNKFLRDQENRIPDYELVLPKVGETFKSGFLKIDMSNIDPSVSVGRILEINPNAKKFSDLSKAEQTLYRENLRGQFVDYLKYFYQEYGVDKEDIESFEEEMFSTPIKSKVAKQKGGPVELSPMPRVNFSEGTKPEEGDTFAKELEYFFLNPDAELPKPQSYKETMNPIEIVNDMIDPRNVPYYADVLTRSGIRVGEFATRIIPAVGKLASDLIRKPAFKVTGTGGNYIQDYGETTPFNIKGTGIFTEFLENITPTATEKAIGLDKLIQQEEQKQKDRRSTIGPKVLADTIGLGVEVTAPIFPGIKLLNAYAKTKNLPTDKVTTELLQKDIDKVLSDRGLDRRQFLQAAGASATIVLAKMLGLGDEIAQSTKVAEKAAETVVDTTPQHFFDLADLIKFYGKEGVKESPRARNIYWKNYELMEDISTGEMRIIKTNEGGARTADGDIVDGIFSEEVMEFKPGEYTEGPDGKFVKTPDEYTEATITPDIDGKMKEFEDGIDETSISKMIEDIDEAGGEEILDKIRFTDK
jgi:cell division FtsZ-interacting protein ZapD